MATPPFIPRLNLDLISTHRAFNHLSPATASTTLTPATNKFPPVPNHSPAAGKPQTVAAATDKKMAAGQLVPLATTPAGATAAAAPQVRYAIVPAYPKAHPQTQIVMRTPDQYDPDSNDVRLSNPLLQKRFTADPHSKLIRNQKRFTFCITEGCNGSCPFQHDIQKLQVTRVSILLDKFKTRDCSAEQKGKQCQRINNCFARHKADGYVPYGSLFALTVHGKLCRILDRLPAFLTPTTNAQS